MSELLAIENRLETLARAVAAQLANRNEKVVFAESCTGGKMAAAITTVPGISSHFCGSSVTYREATKTQWLSVPESELAEHTAESERTTMIMARKILERTPEANHSVAITGHLGPGVDSMIDGKIFVVTGKSDQAPAEFTASKFQLESSDRKSRQAEAACFAFELFLQTTN